LNLRVFWLGLYERDNAQMLPWLFKRDYGRDLAVLINKFHTTTVHYITDDPILQDRANGHPPLTGYHVLVNSVVVSFGISKAVLTYSGSKTVPDVLDWVFALVVGIA
jgi:hypothetical protein